ncbi:alpha/beta hydrolase family protein [Sphingomonas sp. AX6]|uniref:alpha/beta hydrolase family protein n=1 Tax=Sphingomonas sp. AX6 TaxID=2653171 RepID=UPI0012EF073C|nr:hypothetical protein [Sphingomonas sp. AX6]VXC90640.1 conserved exported hypothetical protein [Sphingomonas sp. AX6]
MRCNALMLAPALLLVAGCSNTGMEAPRAALPVSPLVSNFYGETRARDVRTLVVVLHADQDSARLGAQDAFAKAAAAAIPNSAAVAILRPGYADASGRQSPGDRGTSTGDTYTLEHLGEIATAIDAARVRYPGARTVLVGDNGGAAIAANIAGLRPNLLDAMVLVSCPCTLPEWRAHMERRDRASPWEAPVRSLDPLQTAGGVRASLKAVILVGSDDPRALPKFSREYAEALALRGIATDFRVLPGKADDILLDTQVLEATSKLAASLPLHQRADRR